MPHLIVIRGRLGVGKSSVSERLARRLKGKYMSIDALLEKYKLDKVEGKSVPLKNFIKIGRKALPMIKESFRKKAKP